MQPCHRRAGPRLRRHSRANHGQASRPDQSKALIAISHGAGHYCSRIRQPRKPCFASSWLKRDDDGWTCLHP
eukprot:11164624-Lingulodinium_polyedra.AAC.1